MQQAHFEELDENEDAEPGFAADDDDEDEEVFAGEDLNMDEMD